MQFIRFQRWLKSCAQGLAALEFALLAPVLLMLLFGIMIYSIYFTVALGVRQAASEGARAAMAGLTSNERETLAKAQAQKVITNYGTLLNGSVPQVTAAADGVGVFKVTVRYDMTNSRIMQYGGIVPLPNNKVVESSVLVTNGGY